MESHLDGAYKCPTHLSQLLGVCFGPLSSFQVDFFGQYGILSFWLFLTKKTPIFGPTWTWNDTWMEHKSAQHIFSHCLGCVLAHYPVSRWVIGLVWQPTMMVHFDPKKGFFCPPPDLKMAPGEDSMASSHLAICIRKLLVHFEFKVPINVVGRAKNLQK